MKRLILLCAMATLFVSASAQEGVFTNPNGLALDSFSNTTAEGCVARIAGQGVKSVSFTIELTAGTGSIAGKVYLRAASRAGKYATNALDSQVLVAGSANYTFERKDPGHQWYQLYVVPTGTQVTAYKGYYYIRK